MQVVSFVTTSAANVNGEHGFGAVVAFGQYQPAGQEPVHAELLRPGTEPKVFSGHALHVAAPALLNCPATQSKHDEAEMDPPSLPCLVVGVIEPCFPGGHCSQFSLLVAPEVLLQYPAGHGVHCDALVKPTAELNEPWGQSVQFGLPVARRPCESSPNLPAKQKEGLHVTWPSWSV